MEAHNRKCPCGAVYCRTESIAASRKVSSFECAVCGTTLETWNTAWVPTYRLVAGPVKLQNDLEAAGLGSQPPDGSRK
jgi:hypothetical protein